MDSNIVLLYANDVKLIDIGNWLTPYSTYVFSGWSGSVTSNDNPLSLTMDSDKNLTATFVKDSTGTMPILHKREGEVIPELKKLIEEEENINVLVLAANANEKEKNPGHIINALVTKEISTLRIPVMIVPGNFSKDHISQIT